MKLAFNMTRLMEILKIFLEDQLLIKYYITKHLTCIKTQSMTDIKEVLLRWFNNFLIKKLLVLILLLHAHFQRLYGQRPWLSGAVKNEIMSNQQLAQKIHQPVIRKFEKQKEYTYLL